MQNKVVNLLFEYFSIMKVRIKLLLIVFSFLFGGILQAKHIVGGVMSYKCLGNNKYLFTLKVYRDCDPKSGGADFDDPADIGVYLCGKTINCTSLGQFSVFAKPKPKVQDKSFIDPPVYPCLSVPPLVCVEEGVYEFTLTLPQSVNSYHIVYQRCCRNNTITNIVDPANSGATFEVELTPEAQQVCNSSPVFNNFPPTLICANEPLVFDHSATDADGDQLVYELCSPLLGGGPGGTVGNPGNANGCNGVSPSPACPPPYDNVVYLLPNYSFDKPLGKASVLTIDPLTGIMKANPTQLGQFVVGVCVSEYRNGVLLSKIRRDFQFNVANCEQYLNANIKNDKKLGDQQFVINSCGTKTINFENKSTPESSIFSYDWYFPDGVPQYANTKNATITFPKVGTFKGTMVLNTGTVCADTAIIFVNIFPAIKADFAFVNDTCKAAPIVYKDNSFSEAGKIENWLWNFGDGSLKTDQNPVHTYSAPGKYAVKLKVFDLNGCSDSITKDIKYFPVPPLLIVKPSSYLGCIPATIKFNNLSSPLDTSYRIIWDFGDGSTVDALSPSHVYTTPGVYTISLDITSPIGCKTNSQFKNLIKIEPSPIADFNYTPADPSNINPVVTFQDASQYSVSWGWDFGDGNRTFIQNPIHTYQDTGVYTVTLYAKHQSGCIDTLSKRLDIKPIITFFLPNALSPNGDGINDVFQAKGDFIGINNYKMGIWNRWGEQIFSTNDPYQGWQGRVNNVGEFVQNGVYVVKISYTDGRGKNYELKGFATVVK